MSLHLSKLRPKQNGTLGPRALDVFNSLKYLGVEVNNRSEARRINFVNVAGAFGVVVSTVFSAAAFFMGAAYLILINLPVVPGYASVLWLNYKKKWVVARHVLFWVITYQMVLTNTLISGYDVMSHNWFLLMALAALLTSRSHEYVIRTVYVGLFIVCYFVLGLNWLGIEPIWKLPPEIIPLATIGVMTTFVAVTLFLVYMYMQDYADHEMGLEYARNSAKALLRNILPDSISSRLEEGESQIADLIPNATILFADLVGFTELSARVAPQELVKILNDVFYAFDELVEAWGVEKIKTIGDAYMAVGGLLGSQPDHTRRILSLALAMQTAVQASNLRFNRNLSIRIGIHCGPVVAGVIGKSKFSYDIWGDSVNTAARMESHGEPGKIHVTQAVVDVAQADFEFVPRGSLLIKGKGEMKTWFLAPSPREPDL